MNRLFIIGAGFSKAIAKAPLAKGFIKAIYERTSNEDEKYRNAGEWPQHRAAFRKLLDHFYESVIPLVDSLRTTDNKRILNRDFGNFLEMLNIEFVCSFLDLHISHHFTPLAEEDDFKHCPIPFLKGFCDTELKDALSFIRHHTLDLLLPENLSVDPTHFQKMSEFFSEDDCVISFNYDLLVDQMLWRRKLWNPFDGYGFEFKRNGYQCAHETKVKVLKVHGSINWRTPDLFFHRTLELALTHPYTDEPLFEGLSLEKKIHNMEKYRRYPLYSHIILPTFLKSPRHNWEVDLINQAREACKTAEEIYILGYSFPDTDYLTNMFFTEIKPDAHLNIILWDRDKDMANELAQRISANYRLIRKNIKHENTRIEVWIDNDFKFAAYERYLEKQADMERLFKRRRR